jgi:hypothetical protein
MIFSSLFGGLRPSDSFPNESERVLSPKNIENSITICAIAKNEGRYIVEWLAYHLAIGVARIHVYSNDSEDSQAAKLEAIAQQDPRVTWTEWKSVPGVSPQVSAYNDFLKRVSTTWVCYIDIDEFLVPLEDASIVEWLATVPPDVSSVHINWRGFGSAGVQGSDYGLVTRTFNLAADVGWGNHHHFKTVARTNLATEAMIHNIITSSGRRTVSDFSEFEMVNNGLSNRIVHHRIQINHYQCKTFEEFSARMHRGDANVPDGPGKLRDASVDRFRQLDLNDEENTSIRRFDSEVDKQLEWLSAITANL